MTLEEAKKVAAVCQTADGNCISCVDSLTVILNATFPQFSWSTDWVGQDWAILVEPAFIEVEHDHNA